MNQTQIIKSTERLLFESLKWISESNCSITSIKFLLVWESCKWISESNGETTDIEEKEFESLVSE